MKVLSAVALLIFGFRVQAQTLVATPATLALTAQPGQSATSTIVLKNTGSAPLTINGIAFSNPSFTGAGVTAGETFPPGGGSQFGVTFTEPASGGAVTGTMTITSNAPTITVALSGSSGGTTPPPPSGSTPTSLAACALLAGTQTCQQAFGNKCVNLVWTNPSTQGNVTVQRSSSSSGPWTTITNGAPAGGPCLDSTVSAGQTYFYQIEAVVNGETSQASNATSITVPSSLVQPSIAVTISPTASTAQQSVTVTVAVTGTPMPTGSIALSGGGVSQTLTLTNGQASFAIAAGGLNIGQDTLTAAYTPDASSPTYSEVIATAQIIVSPGAPTGVTLQVQ